MNSLGGRIGNRQLAQYLVRQLQSPRLRKNATASIASTAEPEIRIPFRKERNATDILIALEKTVARDPTAAHYKYHDDPFFIPMSSYSRRSFALSKESGRKAAMWILKQHANLFQHKHADPEIPAFMPKAEYKNREEVSEELLMNVIKQGAVGDALTIYKLMEEDTSVESKQALLELLCYHNSEEQLADDIIEERWYRNAALAQQSQIWKNNVEVEKLFDFLKKQDKTISALAYNALICGTAKYMKVNRAWALFEECESKDIPLNMTTYNWLIRLIPVLRDGTPEQRAMLFELFGKINQTGLRPNIGTLNAGLEVLSKLKSHDSIRSMARSLFNDFKKMGVEPSLASYYHALIIFHKDQTVNSTILQEILDALEGQTFTMQDPNDTFFFVKAMEIARYRVQYCNVADKIHKLLLTGRNYDFIGEGLKENMYYCHYMMLLLKNIGFEEFMQRYDLLVPHIYIPEPAVMEEIIDTVALLEASVGHDVLPRLFSHMTMFDQLDRHQLLTKTLRVMRTMSPPPDSPVHGQYAEAAWTLWNHVRDPSVTPAKQISWTGTLLADIALLCLRGNEFDRFLSIVSFVVKNQGAITGTADIEQLNEMFKACLERGHAPGALDVLQCSVEGGFEEAESMGKTIQSTFPLTATQEIQLTNLVGMEVLNTSSTEE